LIVDVSVVTTVECTAEGNCGLLACQVTQKFAQGRMLGLRLKPLLLHTFVSLSFLFFVYFLSFLLHYLSVPAFREASSSALFGCVLAFLSNQPMCLTKKREQTSHLLS